MANEDIGLLGVKYDALLMIAFEGTRTARRGHAVEMRSNATRFRTKIADFQVYCSKSR